VLTIAVWLSIFVFPAIIAIRKHGWFDNVVDTIEAVGTKPHVLFGSLVLSGIMMYVCLSIGMGSIGQLKNQYEVLPTSFQDSVRDTEARASQFYAGNMTHLVDKHVIHHLNKVPFVYFPSASVDTGQLANSGNNGFLQLFTGPVTGLWQILIQGLILGYVLNLFISGGMLTYLIVREDDYWDDENLEDLRVPLGLRDGAHCDLHAPRIRPCCVDTRPLRRVGDSVVTPYGLESGVRIRTASLSAPRPRPTSP
jgi:hypothetical protein